MKIALMAGDGIGPEITSVTKSVVTHVTMLFGVPVEFSEIEVGFQALQNFGTTFPDDVVSRLADCDGLILGPVSHNAYPPREQGGLNPSGELRKALDLFANIRPARSRANIAPKAGQPLDLVIVRENTEGFYADRNMHQGQADIMVTPDVAVAMRRITRVASMNIARAAFGIAQTRSKRVTAVHKANVMRQSCGLFLECCRIVAKQHPDVEYKEQLVDSMAAELVRAPQNHDVIVTTNMFGDILSDLAAELSGSLGLAASLNAGQNIAMAQAQHGSAPDISGQDIANPASLISSAAMLLDWLGVKYVNPSLSQAARAIETAMDNVLKHPDQRTRDLGGALGTRAFGDAVIAQISIE